MALDVGKQIRKRRKEIGMSQVKLAKQAGISQAALSDIERLNNTPSTYTIKKIASVLGCSVADLLDENTENDSSTLRSDEEKLLSYYRKLNSTWKRMLLETAESYSLNPSAQEGLTKKQTIS